MEVIERWEILRCSVCVEYFKSIALNTGNDSNMRFFFYRFLVEIGRRFSWSAII